MNKPTFSVIVCTYNRGLILGHCLEAVKNCEDPGVNWELLLIDNNSNDQTQQKFRDFAAEVGDKMQLRCFKEPQQGLSHARNRGLAEAKASYVFYLDDDAKADSGLLKRIRYLTETDTFDVVGGVYYPWYHFGRPHWYLDKYASNARPYEQLTRMSLPYAASGGVMLWRKKMLESLGGFDPRVGMNGGKFAYGEEVHLQYEAYKQGAVIAYDPHLVIEHIVMDYKLNLKWFFKRSIAQGRDLILGEVYPSGLAASVRYLGKGFYALASRLYRHTPQLLRATYLWQHWVIDCVQMPFKHFSMSYTAFKQSKPNTSVPDNP